MVRDSTVFTDSKINIQLTEENLIGTHRYENILYTGKYLNEAKQDAQKHTQNSLIKHQHVPVKITALGGPFSTEYESVVFYHKKITGSMEWHTVFNSAVKSDSYTVEHYPNYETGELVIEVK